MIESKNAGYKAYAAAPFMMIVLYVLAAAFFWMTFKDVGTVIFFIILALVFIFFMSLYAVVPIKFKNVIRIGNIFLISLLLFGVACISGRQNFQIEGFFLPLDRHLWWSNSPFYCRQNFRASFYRTFMVQLGLLDTFDTGFTAF